MDLLRDQRRRRRKRRRRRISGTRVPMGGRRRRGPDRRRKNGMFGCLNVRVLRQHSSFQPLLLFYSLSRSLLLSRPRVLAPFPSPKHPNDFSSIQRASTVSNCYLTLVKRRVTRFRHVLSLHVELNSTLSYFVAFSLHFRPFDCFAPEI